MSEQGATASRQTLWTVIGVAVFTCCVLAIVATSLRTPMSLDAFWHLRMGQDLVESGLSPFVDHYSFTFAGADVAAPAYPFQVFLYLLVSAFGVDGGFLAYKIFCGVALLAAAAWWLRDVKAPPLLGWSVLTLITVLFQLRATTRPELLSYAFSVLALILLRRAGVELKSRYLWLFALLLLVWCNYHTPLFGYIIMFAFFVDAAWIRLRERAPASYWRHWVLWGAGLTAVGFVNPGLQHSVITMLTFSSEWKSLIDEYAVPTRYAGVWAVYVLALVAAVALTCIISLRRVGFALVWLLLAYNALLTARLVTPAGIIITCLLPWLLMDPRVQQWWQQRPPSARLAANTALVGVVLVSLYSAVTLARLYMTDRQAAWQQFPVAVVDYMRRESLQGRIFNDHNAGGYLIYELAPDSKVHIDGRTGILYPLEHMRRWIRATQNAAALREEIERYDIPLVLLKGVPENHFNALYSGVLTVDYASERFTLWRRDGGNFPLTTLLEIQPACWRDDMTPAMLREGERAEALRMPESRFRQALLFAAGYAAAADRRAFLSELSPGAGWSDPIARMAAYQSLRHGLLDQALEFFSAIARNDLKDLLASAHLRLRRGEPDLAAQILTLASGTGWTHIEPTDLHLMYTLIERTRAAGQRDFIDPQFLSSLHQQMASLGVPQSELALDYASFCTRRS